MKPEKNCVKSEKRKKDRLSVSIYSLKGTACTMLNVFGIGAVFLFLVLNYNNYAKST